MTAQSEAPSAAPEPVSTGIGKLIVPSVIGGLVALTLGIYGRLHSPTGRNRLGRGRGGFRLCGHVRSKSSGMIALIRIRCRKCR